MSRRQSYLLRCTHGLSLPFVVLLTGCAPSVLQRKAVRTFGADFDCPSASVFPSPGGYRVEGCGKVGFYHCQGDPQHDPEMFGPTDPQRSPGDVLFDNFFTSVMSAVKAPTRCWLESEPEDGATSARVASRGRRSAPHQAASALQAPVRDAPVSTLLMLGGGRLALSFDPARSTEYVTLHAMSERVALHTPCRPQLLHDGVSLVVGAVQHPANNELLFVLSRTQVVALRHSVRVDGHLCGLRFSLDSAARQTLAAFASALSR